MPAAHTLFGVAQTINAANLLMFKALKLTTSLSPAAVKIFTDCLIDEHVGQGMDLHWKFQTKIPSEEEYFTMVDGSKSWQRAGTYLTAWTDVFHTETGGLFRLVAGLMRSEATINKDLDISPVMKLFGRFFQARDDYQNLVSSEASLPAATSILPLSVRASHWPRKNAQYTHQKGFAEDIGEGKISLPLIHALRQDGPRRGRLLSILQQRKSDMGLSAEIRKLALDDIKAAGGVEYTRQVVKELQRAVGTSLSLYEAEVGTKNFILRLVQKKLELDWLIEEWL
jgi:ophiobolin F synthase